jgi:hypothetical protein
MQKKKLHTLKDVIMAIQAAVASTGSQKEVAGNLGVSAQYLGDVLSGKREPGKKILDGLKFRKVVYYESTTEQ